MGRALDAPYPAERGDRDRCEFRSFLPAGGCINRPLEEILPKCRGVKSRTTPLRLAVLATLLRLVQLQQVEVEPNCGRCCRRKRFSCREAARSVRRFGALTLMTASALVGYSKVQSGDASDSRNELRFLPTGMNATRKRLAAGGCGWGE